MAPDTLALEQIWEAQTWVDQVLVNHVVAIFGLVYDEFADLL
jgi:hypothetical protein